MRRLAKRIVGEVATAERVPVDKLLGNQRLPRLIRARVLVARHLAEAGYKRSWIAEALNKDQSTIYYYLSMVDRKLSWKPPVVELLCMVVPQPVVRAKKKTPAKAKPVIRRQYLIPYVGADMTQYVWKRRPPHDRAAISSPPLVSDVLAAAGPAGGSGTPAE